MVIFKNRKGYYFEAYFDFGSCENTVAKGA